MKLGLELNHGVLLDRPAADLRLELKERLAIDGLAAHDGLIDRTFPLPHILAEQFGHSLARGGARAQESLLTAVVH